MNICVCFLCGKSYADATKVSMVSFLQNNSSWFNGDIIVYTYENIDCNDASEILSLYEKAAIKKVRVDDYFDLFNHNLDYVADYVKNAFYKFEMFSDCEYDKVLYIDSDIVINGNIENLFYGDSDISFGPDIMVNDVSFDRKKRNFEHINSGLFLIGKKYLNEYTRRSLINYSIENDMTQPGVFNPCNGMYADENVFSCYFKNEIEVLSSKYDCHFDNIPEDCLNDYFGVHFVGDNKPWKHRRKNDWIWWKYYDILKEKDKHCIDMYGRDVYFPKDPSDSDKVIVCASIKNENDYIEEWVKHYLSIGFDKVILADNNDESDSLQNILYDYVIEGKVQIFKMSGEKGLQIPVYKSLANEKNYKWLACFDADEFMELSPLYDSVKDFLSEINEDCVLLNWMLYGPDGQLFKENGPVQERFKNPVYPISLLKDNFFVKPIIKNTCPHCEFDSSHSPDFNGEGTYNFGGYFTSKYYDQVVFPVRYKKAYVKHYYTKSFEEFQEKIKRGWPDGNLLERLGDFRHYEFLDSSTKVPLLLFSEQLFSASTEKEIWIDEVMNSYNVLVFTFHKESKLPNYFSFLFYLSRQMERFSGYTFIVDDNLDEYIYTILLEIAIRTGNRLISIKDGDTDAYWRMYLKYGNKEKSETYYAILIK